MNNPVAIDNLAKAIGLAVVILSFSLVAQRDTPAPQNAFDVAYVGERSAADDTGFVALRSAIRSRHGAVAREVRLRYVSTDGADLQALGSTLADLARQHPSLVVLPTGDAAAAGKQALGEVPAVFASYLDPVRAGFVEAINAPGGRLTGVSLADWLCEYRLDLLRRSFPGLRRIAVVADQSWADHYDGPDRLARYSAEHQVEVIFVRADDAEQVDRVMSASSAHEFDAWYFPPTYTSYVAEALIRSHLQRLQRPAMHATLHEVVQGGQLAYGQDTGFVWDALAELIERILAGEPPGQIPVETPRRFVLAVRSDASFSRQVSADVMREADTIFVSSSR